MTPDERQLLAGLFDRVRDAAQNPRDREADAYIADRVKESPHAAYALAQAVLVQDQALAAANDRLQQLEARVRELEPKAADSGSFLGGIGRSMFGERAAPAAPQGGPWNRTPQAGGFDRDRPIASPAFGQPATPQGGPWAGQAARGGGFLTGALGMAAGVAGGMLLANSIGSLFGGQGAPHGATAFSGFGADRADRAADTSPNALPPLDEPFQPDPTYRDAGVQDAGWDSGGDFSDDGSADV